MNPLRVLTLRGLGLVLVGAATIAGGYQLGQRDFVVLGTLALALPLLGLLTVARTPRIVTHRRALTPSRIPAGAEAQVLLQIANSSSVLPIGGLLVADSLPVLLGQEHRFAVGYLGPRGTRDLSYRIRAQMRGRFQIGPLRLWCTDALGCVRLPRALGPATTLLVTPPVVPLPESPLTRGSATAAENPTRPMSGAGEDDVLPREYRRGDDLRRVHWRSTARHGQLMVRREEHQWRDRSEILLDTRAAAHAGAGPGSSLEFGVSATASIALHLLERGNEVRVATPEGELANGRAQDVLDALTLVREAPAGAAPAVSSLRGGAEALSIPGASGRGLLIAVLGALDAADTAALARERGTTDRTHVALLCGRAAWSEPAALQRSEEALTNAGWTVLRADSVDELARVWPQPPIRPGSRGGTT
ncbi:uncharacterized protein (DUF58 family) [Lipingzhangella halophila]|uniref:Uncharacterized protein (DUF58 family) n=1 Tax=Lipingzhangella halophila TaxID=1783352 RepID=A0A7W7RFF8_9ACTN|nr:DUF58 domain-containing protein [Lipingzhangella halophila]MBB4930937.1 uncharacterized protein (DUF58 family) [Lipingzhangella halophila]